MSGVFHFSSNAFFSSIFHVTSKLTNELCCSSTVLFNNDIETVINTHFFFLYFVEIYFVGGAGLVAMTAVCLHTRNSPASLKEKNPDQQVFVIRPTMFTPVFFCKLQSLF